MRVFCTAWWEALVHSLLFSCSWAQPRLSVWVCTASQEFGNAGIIRGIFHRPRSLHFCPWHFLSYRRRSTLAIATQRNSVQKSSSLPSAKCNKERRSLKMLKHCVCCEHLTSKFLLEFHSTWLCKGTRCARQHNSSYEEDFVVWRHRSVQFISQLKRQEEGC